MNLTTDPGLSHYPLQPPLYSDQVMHTLPTNSSSRQGNQLSGRNSSTQMPAQGGTVLKILFQLIGFRQWAHNNIWHLKKLFSRVYQSAQLPDITQIGKDAAQWKPIQYWSTRNHDLLIQSMD